MTSDKLRPITVSDADKNDGAEFITARVTLSVEDWRRLVEDVQVGMFQPDTLRNRIENLLFWSLRVEADMRQALSDGEPCAIEHHAPASQFDSKSELDDVPF